ncbi:hypothetical protein [Halorussus caseinilyticus]|uniref:Uncharacterized protein n=1 Tax=Halorussus caseinilyticus TaxID=3034025 RepID=A0ABD5WMZ8_9EURY
MSVPERWLPITPARAGAARKWPRQPREVVGSEATDCSADAVCLPVDERAKRARRLGRFEVRGGAVRWRLRSSSVHA